MAGQLASLPLSIQLNDNARPYDGALLYIYDAGTTTPAVFYEDFATTIALSWPLVADTSGRIPMFWVADGSYRVRLTDNAGNEIFDINSITSVGPSTGTSGGGTGVSSDQIFQTGDFLWLPRATTRSGWVRGNALTIGSSSSGATERANADCQTLFEYLWNNFADSLCPVTTGRGSSSINDWNANKRIATLDMRGITNSGLDTMGNSAAGRIAAAITPGLLLGAESTTQIPIHSHASGTLAASSHIHPVAATAGGTYPFSLTTDAAGAHTHSYTAPSGSANDTTATGGQPRVTGTTGSNTGSSGSHTHTASGSVAVSVNFNTNTGISGALGITGSTAATGASSISLLNPLRAGTWYIKL